MGGSGGGGGEPAVTADVQGTETYGRAPTTQTFQPMLPGQEGMIASQLNKGFGAGGNLDTLQGMLASLYKPMNITKFVEPPSATKQMYDKKKYAALNTGNPILDLLLMGKDLPNKEVVSTPGGVK